MDVKQLNCEFILFCPVGLFTGIASPIISRAVLFTSTYSGEGRLVLRCHMGATSRMAHHVRRIVSHGPVKLQSVTESTGRLSAQIGGRPATPGQDSVVSERPAVGSTAAADGRSSS